MIILSRISVFIFFSVSIIVGNGFFHLKTFSKCYRPTLYKSRLVSIKNSNKSFLTFDKKNISTTCFHLLSFLFVISTNPTIALSEASNSKSVVRSVREYYYSFIFIIYFIFIVMIFTIIITFYYTSLWLSNQ